MKERIKNILKATGLYHPLQSLYRVALSLIQKAVYRNKYKKYKGDKFTCNVCGSSYDKFVDDLPGMQDAEAISKHRVIAGYGENIICPRCMSTARERLVLSFLAEMELDNKKVLHFSPEKHIYSFLKKKSKVITVDLLPGFYKIIDPKIQKADATGLHFEDDRFDLVIANHIMEHIPADKAAMREIYRVLKPSGRAILQVPYSEIISSTLETKGIDDPVLQSKLYGQKDHVRIYALDDYIDRLQSTGFEVKKILYTELAHLYKYAIQENESFLQIVKPKA